MVVGCGIAGMQTALDLADSGFYVYLVEKSASIGGRHGPVGQDVSHQRLCDVSNLTQTGRGRPAPEYRAQNTV